MAVPQACWLEDSDFFANLSVLNPVNPSLAPISSQSSDKPYRNKGVVQWLTIWRCLRWEKNIGVWWLCQVGHDGAFRSGGRGETAAKNGSHQLRLCHLVRGTEKWPGLGEIPKVPHEFVPPSSKWWCKFTDSKGTIFGDLTKTNWLTCSANGLHSWWENKHVGLHLETHRHPNFLKAPNGTSIIWEIHYGDMLYSFGGFLKPLGGDLTNQVSRCG